MSKYTLEQEAELYRLHVKEGLDSEQIAEELELSKRSVAAKLGSMGIYKSKGYRNKSGEVPVKKSEYVAQIANAIQADPELAESLEKANKAILKLLAEFLAQK